jgi:hypothetical protein
VGPWPAFSHGQRHATAAGDDHHNRPDLTALALNSLRRNTLQPYRLLLIVNPSGDELHGLAHGEKLVDAVSPPLREL